MLRRYLTAAVRFIAVLLPMLAAMNVRAESGYDLWLRYVPLDDAALHREYAAINSRLLIDAGSSTLQAAREELRRGLKGMLAVVPDEVSRLADATLVVAPEMSLPGSIADLLAHDIDALTLDGYLLRRCRIGGNNVTVITARTDVGVLYGVFAYLKLMQTHRSLARLNVSDSPKLKYRILNHWDNLNGTVERGYAGYSIWNWERLPRYKDPRYKDYARANASIGINGAVLNNVNAQAVSLRHDMIVKASGIADALRPYGIKVYLTAKFSAPIEIGGLKTANPADSAVQRWWKAKVREIYDIIPDFGGFLVKANSEGQPGPQDYGCSHADGANMLAEALEPFGGVVFWRAFVYKNERHIDRVVTGYNEFKPLDGKFHRNVFVQPKNGPIDFQPREPFHPLFGSMPATPLSMELQITQENLGHAGHLVYLGTLYEETLKSDTFSPRKGFTVSKVLQQYQASHGVSALAGVPNIGTDLNWTGHIFGQANWFAFGAFAWNPDADARQIAEDWTRMTLTNDDSVVNNVLELMMMSREAYVHYTMPLGLNHIMNFASHNGPEPWHHDKVWTAFDYHRVSKDSIGVNRTASGSGAVLQYHEPVCSRFADVDSCPDELLLWFHRLPWTYTMKSGRTLWDELVRYYYHGVDEVKTMQHLWNTVRGAIDAERHGAVAELLQYQEQEAIWWRDACVLFFGEYSGMPIPPQYEPPVHSLKYYRTIPFPYDWKGYYGE